MNLNKPALIYIISEIVSKSSGYILLPFLSNELGVESYGILLQCNSLVSLLMNCIIIGSSAFYAVEFFKRSDVVRNQLYVMILLIMLIHSTVCFVALLAPRVSSQLEELGLTKQLYVLVVLCAWASAMKIIVTTKLRFEEKPMHVLVLQTSIFILQIVVTILCFQYIDASVELRLICLFISLIISIVYFIKVPLINSEIIKYFTFIKLKEFYKFGAPLLAHSVSGWSRAGGDRIVIGVQLGAGAVGTYGMAHQVSSILLIITQGLLMGYSPIIYKQLAYNKRKNTQNAFKIAGKVVVYLGLIAILLYFLINNLLISSLGNDFHQAKTLTLPLLLAFWIKGCYMTASLFLYYNKKTLTISIINTTTSLMFITCLPFVLRTVESGGIDSLFSAAWFLVASELLLATFTICFALKELKKSKM